MKRPAGQRKITSTKRGRPAVAETELRRLREELALLKTDWDAQARALIETQRELEASREHLAAIYDLAPTGQLTLDDHGFIREANLVMAQWLGVPRERLIGRLLSHHVVRGDWRRVTKHLYRCRHNRAVPVSTEIAFAPHGRASRYVQLISIPAPPQTRVRRRRLFLTAVVDVTERKAVEAALRKSELIHRAIGESIKYGIWICTADGRNIYASESFLKLVGLTQEQCSNFGWGDTLHPEDAARTIQAWQECVRTEGTWDIEHRFRGVDGQWHHILARGVPVRDEQDRILCWAGINLDIRRLKEAEAALVQARAELEQKVRERTAELQQTMQLVEAERRRFREVLNRLPAYLVLLSPDHRVHFANQFFEQRFGKPDGRRRYEHLIQRREACENIEALNTQAPHRREWTGPDGRIYEIYDSPFTDADGSSLVLEVGLDVTERKQAEEAVRRANAYNRSLVEANLDPLLTIGPDGKITDVNAATEAATGYDRAVLVGTDFSNYFTEPEKARAGYQEVFRVGSVRDYPLELRHRDGHATSVLYNASVYRDESGKVAGVFAAARDLTERRRAEQEQQVLREELARFSRIAAAGQLAASLAHELNQPLGAIVCNIQAVQNYLAQGGAYQPEVGEALKDIEADGKRAGAVIYQLRRLYQKTSPTKATLQLNDVLQRTLDLLHSEFVFREVELELGFDPRLPAILGNEVELQQVVLNLVTNAVEAMAAREPGARRLRIRTARVSTGGVQVSVRDSGPGLPEDQLQRLFEPFYTTKPAGMGMGLSIGRSIVEAHNGRLWGENNSDGGATFHFTLPAGEGTPG